MDNKLEGVSETVEAVADAIWKKYDDLRGGKIDAVELAKAAIPCLLASGEVILASDLKAQAKVMGDEILARGEVVTREVYDQACQEANMGRQAEAEANAEMARIRADHDAEMEKVRESVVELKAKLKENAQNTLLALQKYADSLGKQRHQIEELVNALELITTTCEYQGFCEHEVDHAKEVLSHFTTNHATTGETE